MFWGAAIEGIDGKGWYLCEQYVLAFKMKFKLENMTLKCDTFHKKYALCCQTCTLRGKNM